MKTNKVNVQLLEVCKIALAHMQILGSGQRSPYSNAEMCEVLGKAIARATTDQKGVKP
jgi:hypothetical protein